MGVVKLHTYLDMITLSSVVFTSLDTLLFITLRFIADDISFLQVKRICLFLSIDLSELDTIKKGSIQQFTMLITIINMN